MPRITTFLTYDHQAEEAATFYVSVFDRSRVLEVVRYGAGAPAPEGTVMTVAFELDGQRFVALNGGRGDRGAGAPPEGDGGDDDDEEARRRGPAPGGRGGTFGVARDGKLYVLTHTP